MGNKLSVTTPLRSRLSAADQRRRQRAGWKRTSGCHKMFTYDTCRRKVTNMRCQSMRVADATRRVACPQRSVYCGLYPRHYPTFRNSLLEHRFPSNRIRRQRERHPTSINFLALSNDQDSICDTFVNHDRSFHPHLASDAPLGKRETKNKTPSCGPCHMVQTKPSTNPGTPPSPSPRTTASFHPTRASISPVSRVDTTQRTVDSTPLCAHTDPTNSASLARLHPCWSSVRSTGAYR